MSGQTPLGGPGWRFAPAVGSRFGIMPVGAVGLGRSAPVTQPWLHAMAVLLREEVRQHP